MASVALTEESDTEIILSFDYRAVTMERIIVLLFFCIAVEGDIGKHIYISKSLNWNDAQAYCRRYHTDLSFFNRQSDIDRLRKDTEIKNITEQVWIGLRFLGDRWMWVNGDPLEYEAWSQEGGQDHQCPIRKRCGVLTNERLWENRDCQEKLYFISEAPH
uniref:C-type lectin domain-containing protein n=1 Tax=Amphiprion percula TaxID=161767 RepID=A0A3P8RMZ0_AMPPE